MPNKRKRSNIVVEYFDFEFNGAEETDDSKLKELKKRNIQHQKPRNFVLHEPYWSESLLTSFVDVFLFFSSKGQLWDTLQIIPREGFPSSTTHCYLRPLLFAANSMNLFRAIDVSAPLIPGGEKSNMESILSGVLLNTRLESLSISCPLELLPEGDFRALLKLLRQTTTLQELTLNRLAITSGEVADALAQNSTLKKVSLNVTANDMGLSTLIQALNNNRESSKLEDLAIQTDLQFGILSSKALQSLLLSSTTLKMLTLQDNCPFCPNDVSRKLNLQDILDGLQGSRSLKCLSMKNVFCKDSSDNNILSEFFPAIRSSRTLERLDLLRTRICPQDLEHVTNHMPRLKKPFRLSLDRRLLLDQTAAFRRMLQAHPEIRREWPRNVVAGTEEGCKLKHVWELNWHGRSLLQASTTMEVAPLSIWPTLLEKANDKPDVLFTFLQGPAFAGSQNHQ
ncbi:MAG: hypothetical protein SGBAC_012615 [Bacillariaceae sp.]